jgi:hypothetical protein
MELVYNIMLGPETQRLIEQYYPECWCTILHIGGTEGIRRCYEVVTSFQELMRMQSGRVQWQVEFLQRYIVSNATQQSERRLIRYNVSKSNL